MKQVSQKDAIEFFIHNNLSPYFNNPQFTMSEKHGYELRMVKLNDNSKKIVASMQFNNK